MNVTDPNKAITPEVLPKVDQALVRQVVTELAEANPYGFGKYEDEDATLLGLPSLGALRLAHNLVKQWIGTPFVPKFIAQSPNPAGTFVATVVRGHELGFKMMESLSCLYLSPDGRLGMYGTAMLALMRKSKIKIKFSDILDDAGKYDGCSIHGVRENGDEYTARFTHTDSVRAGLMKGGSNHEKYPQYMCKWRAVSDLFRTLASDLSGGPIYTREELEEEERETAATTNSAPAANPFMAGMESDETPAGAPGATAGTEAGNGVSAQPEAAAAKTEPPQSGKTTTIETRMYPCGTIADGHGPLPEQCPVHGKDCKPASPTSDSTQDKPKAAAEPKKQDLVANSMNAILDEVAKTLPDAKTRDNLVKEFFRGFTQQNTFKVKDPKLPECLRVFLAVAKSPFQPKLVQDAYGTGTECRAGWAKLLKYVDKWPEDCRQMALNVGLSRYADCAGGDLVDYLDDPIQAQGMKEPDLRQFMTVLSRFPNDFALATKYREVTKGGTAVALNLAECSEGDLLTALAGGTPKAADQPKAEPAQQEQMEDLFTRIRGEGE